MSGDVPVCPYDGKPCSRALSALNGDLDCGEITQQFVPKGYERHVIFTPRYYEVEIRPVCPRWKR